MMTSAQTPTAGRPVRLSQQWGAWNLKDREAGQAPNSAWQSLWDSDSGSELRLGTWPACQQGLPRRESFTWRYSHLESWPHGHNWTKLYVCLWDSEHCTDIMRHVCTCLQFINMYVHVHNMYMYIHLYMVCNMYIHVHAFLYLYVHCTYICIDVNTFCLFRVQTSLSIV